MSSEEKKDEVKTETSEPTVEAVPSMEDVARTGIKEDAKDAEAMAMAKDKTREAKDAALPSFFIEKGDRRKVEVDILTSPEDGRVLSVSRVGMGVDFNEFSYLRHDVMWFEFSVPSYEDMSTYRQRSGVFRREVGQMLVDRLQLRNFFLVWHLKDWSLTDKEGKKVELTHDDDGSLSDESLKKVYVVHPTIIDVVLTVLEKEILLT